MKVWFSVNNKLFVYSHAELSSHQEWGEMNPNIYSRCLRAAKLRRIKGGGVSEEPQWGKDPGVSG